MGHQIIGTSNGGLRQAPGLQASSSGFAARKVKFLGIFFFYSITLTTQPVLNLLPQVAKSPYRYQDITGHISVIVWSILIPFRGLSVITRLTFKVATGSRPIKRISPRGKGRSVFRSRSPGEDPLAFTHTTTSSHNQVNQKPTRPRLQKKKRIVTMRWAPGFFARSCDHDQVSFISVVCCICLEADCDKL
jgi:hypothetical protein